MNRRPLAWLSRALSCGNQSDLSRGQYHFTIGNRKFDLKLIVAVVVVAWTIKCFADAISLSPPFSDAPSRGPSSPRSVYCETFLRCRTIECKSDATLGKFIERGCIVIAMTIALIWITRLQGREVVSYSWINNSYFGRFSFVGPCDLDLC